MKSHKIYWSLAILAIIFHIVAVLLTYYAIEFLGSYECNSIMSYSFNTFGYIFSELFSTLLFGLVFIILFITIQFIFNNSKYKDLILMLFGFIYVIIMGVDMLNDVFSLLHSDLWYYTNLIIDFVFELYGIKSYC
jgi:Co/Zn/Cd efflux system component